uniref:Uncharacterized protein n=1 Tax=Arundo donax TaxID=35708 RepID=A0A0A8YVT3_ARUDO
MRSHLVFSLFYAWQYSKFVFLVFWGRLVLFQICTHPS